MTSFLLWIFSIKSKDRPDQPVARTVLCYGGERFEMRKRVEVQSLSDPRQNAKYIFKFWRFFVHGDIQYIINSFCSLEFFSDIIFPIALWPWG
jgi:hypothetical protein